MASISSEFPTPPKRRGMLIYFIECVILRLMGYPAARCHYTTQNVRIPITTSTGPEPVELAAELLHPILPAGQEPIGTVLQTSPYGLGFAIGIVPRAFAARGYQVLIICARGTFDSGGEFDPFGNDVEDAQGVFKWMRKQPWYTGKFATVGGSYASFTQWSLMEDPPQDMVASLAMVSIHDISRSFWDTGALNIDFVP